MVKSNLTELTPRELNIICGGNLITFGKAVLKYGRRIVEAIGAYELYSEFKEGWDSVECSCDQK